MSNSPDGLHPLFRPVAKAILEESQAKITSLSPGSLIRWAVTFRPLADQAAAKAVGKSQVSLGWHQFGLAVDAAVITPEGVYVANGEDERYRIFGLTAVAHGCIWGGNWTKPDWDHAEWHPDFTLTQYVAWLDAHRVVTA